MEGEPEKGNSQESWEEAKHKAQSDFSTVIGGSVTMDRIRIQRLLNAEFWTREILHEQLGEVSQPATEHQHDLDKGIEPER